MSHTTQVYADSQKVLEPSLRVQITGEAAPAASASASASAASKPTVATRCVAHTPLCLASQHSLPCAHHPNLTCDVRRRANKRKAAAAEEEEQEAAEAPVAEHVESPAPQTKRAKTSACLLHAPDSRWQQLTCDASHSVWFRATGRDATGRQACVALALWATA